MEHIQHFTDHHGLTYALSANAWQRDPGAGHASTDCQLLDHFEG